MVGALAACASLAPDGSPPVEDARRAPAAAAPAPSAAGASGAPAGPIARENALWQPAAWADLPGWSGDSVLRAWPALLASCASPAPGWTAACASARALADPDEAHVRAWLQATLQPYRVLALDGRGDGLATGYFEPLVIATRNRPSPRAVALHAPPADLASRRPWYTRAEIDALPAARQALAGREIAWVADPLDALLLQVQGSGRLALTDTPGADGRPRLVRLAYAGHNDRPYQSVARWLVERGAFTLEQASWPAIRAWARANPQRLQEMLNANPRYVFFREEPLPDPAQGPRGAQGVPLTPGRSIAVDPRAVPYGTPVWLDTTEPAAWVAGLGAAANAAAARPLQRLVVAQDTGSAITGAVRADYFWGWGDGADEMAGRMKQPLRMWVLWPKAAPGATP